MPRAAERTKLRKRLFCDITFSIQQRSSATGSATVNQQSKCPRNRGGLRLGLLRGRCCCRSKIRRVNEKPVRFGVERHVASPKFSFDCFNYAEFVRSVFMEDVESAFARGREEQTLFGFVNIRVYSIPDGKRLENLPVVSIHDSQHLVAPAD